MGSFKSVFITAVQVCDGPIDHLHYDVIRAKPDGSCSRSAETGASVWQKRRETSGKARGSETLLGDERDKNNVAQGSHALGKKMSLAPIFWRLVYFKNPKLFAATSRQLEM